MKKTESLASCVGMLIGACLTVSLTGCRSVEGPLEPFLGPARMDTQQVFDKERFPNIVVTMKGTVVATWGSSSVRARRSEDGGQTW